MRFGPLIPSFQGLLCVIRWHLVARSMQRPGTTDLRLVARFKENNIFRRNVPLLLLNHTDWTLSCCASYIPYKHAIIILLDFDTELSFLFFISMMSVWHIYGYGYFYSVTCSRYENFSDCAVSFVPVEFCHSSCDTSLCHSHLIVAGGEARRPL